MSQSNPPHIDPDLSLQVQQENAALKKKISLLENIIEQFPGHVYWLDRDFVYQGCNITQAKSFGLDDPKQIVGYRNTDFGLEAQAPQLDALNKEVMETGKEWQTEEFAVFVNGPGYYLSRKMPLRNEQKEIIGVLGVSLDITRLKQIEAELAVEKEMSEQAYRAKSEFIMNISHDIRTPFTGILGIAEILLKNETDAEKLNMLQMIYDSGKNLLSLLNSVINIISQESVTTSKMKSFSLVQCIERCSETFRGEVTRRNIDLKLKIASNIPSNIIGDHEYIDRILLNLVGNAIKFTQQGEVVITADCKEITDNTVTVLLQVSDTGIGIPKEKLGGIFEKFSRVQSSFSSTQEGAGLGLWLVRQTITQLGGIVSVASELGKGATFTCEIPMAYQSEENVTITTENYTELDCPPSTRLPMKQKPKRILLLEDVKIAQIAASLIFQHVFDADVTITANVAEAKEAVLSNQYDLLVLDIGLPDGSGDEVARLVREGVTKNHDVPIVGLSAHVSDQSVSEIADYFDKIILKPLSYQTCQSLLESDPILCL